MRTYMCTHHRQRIVNPLGGGEVGLCKHGEFRPPNDDGALIEQVLQHT